MRMIPLIFLALFFSYASGHIENFVELVVSVKKYFTSGCVYLLHDTNEYLNETAMTVKIGKLMFKRYIQTTLSALGNGSTGCQNNRPLFIVPDKDRMYNRSIIQENFSSAIWLKFLEKRSLIDFFRNKSKPIPFDCEFLVAQPEGNHTFNLTEVYNISPALPLQIYTFGNWTSHEGLSKPSIGFYYRRKNLLGAILKTAVDQDSSFCQNDKGEQFRKKDFFEAVWIELKTIMNFTPEYRTPQRSVHGIKLKNGSWNGILGLMQRKEVDVTCEDISMAPSRAEIVDFMVPLKKDRQYVLMKKCNSFELSWSSFLLPFSTGTWIAVIVTMMTLAFLLWMIYLVGCRYWKERLDGFIFSFHLHDSFFCIFGSFCQQGQNIVPRSASGRVVFLVSYLTSVVLLSGYSASLISYLTLRRPVIPFSTFNGLLHASYQFGILPYSSVFSFFEEGGEPIIRELYNKFIAPHKHSLPATLPEGLQRICEDHKYAFMATLDDLEKNSGNLTCQIAPATEAFLPGSRAMAVSKGCPYRGLFTHYLLKLGSVGILRRLQLSTSTEQVTEESVFVVMDMKSVAPIFTILAVGTVMATLLLLMEMVAYRDKNTNNDSITIIKKHPNKKRSAKTFHFNYRRSSGRESLKIDFRF